MFDIFKFNSNQQTSEEFCENYITYLMKRNKKNLLLLSQTDSGQVLIHFPENA